MLIILLQPPVETAEAAYSLLPSLCSVRTSSLLDFVMNIRHGEDEAIQLLKEITETRCLGA
jgi:hypothetical protein